jgi:dipeptidyl aminopeptidase/acylaminoacyl peptidase
MKRICFPLILSLSVACQSVARAPQATSAPLPIFTTTIVPTPSPTLTPSPTPTVEQWIHPYTIDGLRHHKFQSGEVTVLVQLEQTEIYTRYLIRYPSDGLMVTGIMQVPREGKAPFPVIVMNHGFFSRTSYASGDGTWRAAEYLNQHGYLTLAPDYRSWGGSDSGPSLFYSGLVIDVVNLLNAIPSIPQADADRIGMWGHSMGGGVTMKVLEVDSYSSSTASASAGPRVRAAVFYSTVSADDADLIDRWGPGCIGDIAAGELRLGCNSSDILPLDLPPGLIQAYGRAASDPALLHEISSIYHLDLVSAPVQINYGTNDGKTLAGTPPEWSKKVYQALKDAGKDAQLFAYEDELHSFNGDNWIAFMERSAHFFDKYVKQTP